MDKNFLARERRRQAILERLGTNTPRCVFCGESDPRCLEQHHLSGQQFGDELVIECRNCHRVASDLQKDHPKKIGSPPSLEERLAHFLVGLADFFEMLIDTLHHFADQLLANLTHPQFEGGRK